MFAKKNRSQSGFTLFEIILVMLVVMVAVVALITFTGRKTQETAAEQLGYRLFQYGLAVTDYARQNPDGFSPDNEPETMYGYEWLQEIDNPETNKPFLGENFTLNVPPLRIKDVEKGEGPLKTVFRLNETGHGNYEVLVDLIELGTITKPTTTTARGESTEMFTHDLSLSGAAANYATSYRNRDGAAVIRYRLEDDFADNPEDAHIVGEPKLDVGLSDYWLLISGENKMQGPLQFNEGVVSDNRRIAGVNNIEFSDQPGDTREILGVNTIGFADNGTVMRGLRASSHRLEVRPGGSNADTEQLTLIANSFCLISGVELPGGGFSTCTIRENGNNWELYARVGSSASSNQICHAQCIEFNWQ